MTRDELLARAYRLLFHYETAGDDVPAWLSAMGQLDCLIEIAILEGRR